LSPFLDRPGHVVSALILVFKVQNLCGLRPEAFTQRCLLRFIETSAVRTLKAVAEILKDLTSL